MTLKRQSLTLNQVNPCEGVMVSAAYFLFSSPSERTADDLEIIYEELLHIKALSHLSTTVSKGCHCACRHRLHVQFSPSVDTPLLFVIELKCLRQIGDINSQSFRL